MCGETGPSEEKFKKYSLPGRAGENFFFLFPRRGQCRLAKMYKFLAKMNQNAPIPHNGEENVNLIPLRGVPAKKKFPFSTRGILEGPCPIPPNAVSRKKINIQA